MSERKWHQVAGSATFKPGAGRFERAEAIIFITALGGGLLIFKILIASFGFSVFWGFIFASSAPAATATFLICFVSGKPRHHAADAIAWLWALSILWLSTRGFAFEPKPLIELHQNDFK